jgi:hypothetical protein
MDPKFKTSIQDFLEQKTIAIAGYSSDNKQFANAIADKFRKNGYVVYGINPKFREKSVDSCYPDLRSIPVKPDAVLCCTPPPATMDIVKECIDLKIWHVWMHQSFGQGSHNKEAVKLCRENGISCIPSGCPMMFLKADPAHVCFRWILNLTGRFKS